MSTWEAWRRRPGAAVWELRAALIAPSQRAADKSHAAQMRGGAGEWPRGWYCTQMKKNSCAPDSGFLSRQQQKNPKASRDWLMESLFGRQRPQAAARGRIPCPQASRTRASLLAHVSPSRPPSAGSGPEGRTQGAPRSPRPCPTPARTGSRSPGALRGAPSRRARGPARARGAARQSGSARRSPRPARPPAPQPAGRKRGAGRPGEAGPRPPSAAAPLCAPRARRPAL